MADILQYRIPHKEPITLYGDFYETDFTENELGFVVTSFNGDRKFIFKKSDQVSGKLHFLEKAPYVISKEDYIQESTQFLASFESKKIQKAIYSRIKSIDFNEDNIIELYKELCVAYPKAFVYLISSPLFGTWIGASPETLLKAKGGKAETMSLAGTKTIDKTDVSWGTKEVQEQKFVTDFILDQLENLGIDKIEKQGPMDEVAGPVIHLKTKISFELGNNSMLKCAQKLHPTPAVSGVPRDEALHLIAEVEQHDRDFYAGIIGSLDKTDSHLFVNLRSCQIQKGKLFLYLGGGFTKDSIPELEWEETENKSRTLLNAVDNITK